MIKLLQGDCLEVMDGLIADGVKVDAIITDPPYGITKCTWDSVIPLPAMWQRLNKLIKPNGVVALFGTEPFSTVLRMSNLDHYKYDWYWIKSKPTGFVHCRNRPLRDIELISVFSTGAVNHITQSTDRMLYNPQGLVKSHKVHKNADNKFGGIIGKRPSHKPEYTQEYENYPRMTLNFKVAVDTVHLTQKPLALMEYLVKTYTNKGDTVLDFTMGGGTTGAACKRLNRSFIGIELDKAYYDIAEAQIENADIQKELF